MTKTQDPDFLLKVGNDRQAERKLQRAINKANVHKGNVAANK